MTDLRSLRTWPSRYVGEACFASPGLTVVGAFRLTVVLIIAGSPFGTALPFTDPTHPLQGHQSSDRRTEHEVSLDPRMGGWPAWSRELQQKAAVWRAWGFRSSAFA